MRLAELVAARNGDFYTASINGGQACVGRGGARAQVLAKVRRVTHVRERHGYGLSADDGAASLHLRRHRKAQTPREVRRIGFENLGRGCDAFLRLLCG